VCVDYFCILSFIRGPGELERKEQPGSGAVPFAQSLLMLQACGSRMQRCMLLALRLANVGCHRLYSCELNPALGYESTGTDGFISHKTVLGGLGSWSTGLLACVSIAVVTSQYWPQLPNMPYHCFQNPLAVRVVRFV
jgi:hypothetical protein